MSLLERVEAANRYSARHFRRFYVSGQAVGFIKQYFADELRRWPKVFQVQPEAVWLHPRFDSADDPVQARSAAVAEVLQQLHAEGLISGWRNECYAVNRGFHQPPLLVMERAAVSMFGVTGYGIHVNGLVGSGEQLRMWIGQRSLSKPTDPGKLDQIVAGGQPVGLGLLENVIKECYEEAGIPETLARQVQPVGAITYCLETACGLRPDIIYCFDLQLPECFQPRNTDGEVEAFYLWEMAQLRHTLETSDSFKFNCSLVAIDCMIRHGVIAPEHPEYVALQVGLRTREHALAYWGR